MLRSLLIVGASVRPWVASALSAGYRVVALDFFADWDAQQLLCRTQPNSSVIRQINRFDDVFLTEEWRNCDAVVVCGGFENRVDLVRRLALSIPVLGTCPDGLEVLRVPLNVWRRLTHSGFQVPATKTNLQLTDQAAQWLRKKAGTSGGRGVRRAAVDDVGGGFDAGVYFQSMVDGESCSAMFVSTEPSAGVSQTWLVGVTRQLVGERKFGASQFSYCGSVGPIGLPLQVREYLGRLGRCLGAEFGLIGVWGLDFVWNDRGVWPVDLNARLTASMELYEWVLSEAESPVRSVIDLHVRACQGELDGPPSAKRFSGGGLVEGKAILFNDTPADFQIDGPCFEKLRQRFDPSLFAENQPGVSIVDVPHIGQTIRIGRPALTLRVRGRSEPEVLELLDIHARNLFGCLRM